MKIVSSHNFLPFLVFVHVEKAGGISLNNMLHHHLWNYITPSPRYGEQFLKKDLEKIQKLYPVTIKGLGGHRVSPTETYHLNQFRFSFVRDPIKRYISHLNWQINKMGINHSFESFIANEYFKNFQTFRLTRTRNYIDAKNVIKKYFNFIGLLEDFDASVELLSRMYFKEMEYLSYEKKNTTEKINETFNYKTLSNKHLDQIRKVNQVDLDIYNWINEHKYLPLKNEHGISGVNTGTLSTPISTILKRKTSNFYLGRIIQPRIQKVVQFGY